MLSKILIANRGEIAVRVIRACREMGITAVAVYSDLDRDSLHVRLADEAYALGGETATESYLNTEKILDIIERCGADGVHPGYGFFSENADFSRAITERGVTFIGPPAEAIEMMGDKVSSRRAAERAGVAGVPGTTEFLSSAEQIVDFGNAHGWPVAIKAAYGGGGRGMRVVSTAADAAAAFESAQSEALKGFGRGECYVERYLTWPRHVEMQVFADTHGNTVWLGERDCSAQRRHQKLIEESPAPLFNQETRLAMGEAAVRVAEGCGYVNAGTVEFLYQDGEFYFLEMNTRLQVEHPVTEMTCGLDLVAEQIRVASGEPLSFTQSEIVRRGSAIEVRINAEDPAEGAFLPSPGKITTLRVPQGFGVRWDGGYEPGDEVSQFYDNLVGKLTVWGIDRPTAISRAIRALEELAVQGIATTVPADLAILRHPDFHVGRHSTRWVEETLQVPGSADHGNTAAGTIDIEDAEPKIRRDVDVEVNGRRFSVSVWVPESQLVTVPPSASGNPRVVGRGAAPRSRRSTPGITSAAGGGEVTVPMQGTIVKVLVQPGDEVEAGQPVCVLEAMKMENNIAADRSGTVTDVKVEAGQSVGSGDVVVVIS